MTEYSHTFYAHVGKGSLSSANIILSAVARHTDFHSIVDVGCGDGSWLRAARELKPDLHRAAGIDGPWTKRYHDGIAADFFYHDLSHSLPKLPAFDLAVCVEVAEHLPPSRTKELISDLTQLSDVVLFSGAIPGQSGTGHINERWAVEWYEEFKSKNFEAYDLLRPGLWTTQGVDPWYAQNIFLFARQGLQAFAALERERITGRDDWRLWLVHPGIFRLSGCDTAGFGRMLKALPAAAKRAFMTRLRRFTGR
jgi:SAM-dependent methyltransferase